MPPVMLLDASVACARAFIGREACVKKIQAVAANGRIAIGWDRVFIVKRLLVPRSKRIMGQSKSIRDAGQRGSLAGLRFPSLAAILVEPATLRRAWHQRRKPCRLRPP